MISDDELKAILDKHEGWTVEMVEFELARLDFYRDKDLRVPHPAQYAMRLPYELARAVIEAKLGRDGYKVSAFVPELRALGLVAFGRHPCLGGFGQAVRRELMIDEK